MFRLDSVGMEALEEKLHHQKPRKGQQDRGRGTGCFAARDFSNNGPIWKAPVFILWYDFPHLSFQLRTDFFWHAVLHGAQCPFVFQLQSETTVRIGRTMFFLRGTCFSKRASFTLMLVTVTVTVRENCSEEHGEADESQEGLHGDGEREFSV